MSDILSISSTAVSAYQRALGTVSNNIANIGTEGYVRQETILTENAPRDVGTVYLGTGVRFDGIRRAYDEFLEVNLRNSTSDLNTQEPMVNYANRIVDIMGSDTVGLPTALDKFFSAARNLSTDPASTILRGQFLRDADGLAGRFQELSGQLDGVDTETRSTIGTKITEINTLATQLAVVNKQLGAETRVNSQPAQLLDQRDLLLTKLSKLIRINVTAAVNGSVNVSIGNMPSSGVIVSGQKSIEIGARFDETDLGRVSIIADPFGMEPQAIVGVSSGALGGLLSFREQVLQPTISQFNTLATVVVNEVNAVHRDGIDANGNTGKDLFGIVPVTLTDPVSGKETIVDRAAAGMRMVLTDQSCVAAGALFRVIEDQNNLSGVDATLSYAPSFADPVRVPALSDLLKNNPDPSAGINAPADLLLGQIPQGSSNWSLYLDNASSSQQLHVFTRDGRQLVGAPLADDAEVRALMTTANGFIAGSTYSDTYLNQSGETGYKQIETFYGLMAKPIVQYGEDTVFTAEHDVLPSVRKHLEFSGAAIDNTLASIEADHLTLNGKSLPGLLPTAPARTLQASDIARWMNYAAEGMEPTISINATTTATYAVANPASGLYINGVAVPADATRTTMAGLISYINDNLGRDTNVVASTRDGALVLTNAVGYGGDDIHIGTMDADGALDVVSTFKGILNFSGSGDVTIGYGTAGVLGDIAQLGKPIGTYYTSVLPKVTIDAQIIGRAMPPSVANISANAVTLNGVALGELDLGRNLQASDIATWLNSAGATLDPAVVATGSAEIRISAGQFTDNLATNTLSINGVSIQGTGAGGIFSDAQDLLDAINNAATGIVSTTAAALKLSKSLKINGVSITGSGVGGVFTNTADLVARINAANTGATPTGVGATFDAATGKIVLRHTIDGDIVIGPAGDENALGVTDGTYSTVSASLDSTGGMILSNHSGADIVLGSSTTRNVFDLGNGAYKGSLTLSSDDEIRVGFGTTGTPAELAKLGLRTSVYIDGATTEDLLVFVTGEGSGTVAGSFDASMAAPASLDAARIKNLRAQNFEVTFTTATKYQVTWKNPGSGVVTVLAERDYDATAGIVYQGLKLTLNNAPMAGDQFAIDGNQDGAGNNQNMLKLIALEKKAMVGGPNGSTLAQAYETEVGKVGNFSNQATIAQKALQVVNDQAVEARDKVSGVSLDSEAADLIRFQQAYQSSAKAMQVAGELFDSILQIR